MYNPTTKRAVLRLALISIAIASFMACDRAPTSPDAHSLRSPDAARHDDIEGDTLNCLSGYIVVGGRYVCN